MREIKFRGQRIDNNAWVYGYFVKVPNGECRIYWQPFEDATSNTYHLVKSESISQFTGLKDKNGKEIYQGDICRFNSDKTSDVVFIDGEFQNRLSQWGLHTYMKCPYTGEQKAPGIEVIGNIHKNPELLK